MENTSNSIIPANNHLALNFTETEAANWLKVSRQTLQRIRLRGDIGFCRVGGTRVVYTFKHLNDYLDARERAPYHGY